MTARLPATPSVAQTAMRCTRLFGSKLILSPLIARFPAGGCGAPLQGREGRFVLKYYFLSGALGSKLEYASTGK
jgi:hypothetical protein